MRDNQFDIVVKNAELEFIHAQNLQKKTQLDRLRPRNDGYTNANSEQVQRTARLNNQTVLPPETAGANASGGSTVSASGIGDIVNNLTSNVLDNIQAKVTEAIQSKISNAINSQLGNLTSKLNLPAGIADQLGSAATALTGGFTNSIKSSFTNIKRKYNPRDIADHINPNQGTACFLYENLPGGEFRPTFMKGTTKKIARASTEGSEFRSFEDASSNGIEVNPEACTTSGYSTTSEQQTVRLPNNVQSAGGGNWCGSNNMPLVNGKFNMSRQPNGSMQPGAVVADDTPEDMHPILRPGESCDKGFGNNYIHKRTSDKMDIICSAKKDGYDPDYEPIDETASEDAESQYNILNLRL